MVKKNKGKTAWGAVSIIAVLSVLGAGYLYFSSYPEMDIAMYYSDNSLISTSNIELTLYTEDNDYNRNSGVCFQVRNSAENVAPNKVDATNFKVWIETNAICENCNANTPFGAFSSQSEEKVCRNVKAPSNLEKIQFTVIPKYDALGLHWEPATTFSCNFDMEEKNLKHFICNLDK